MNVTALGATAPTFLTVWPDGDLPNASSLNPFPGQPPTPNAVTVDLAGDGSFRVYNLQGSVEVIIDVTGFYTNTSPKELGAAIDSLSERLQSVETVTDAMSIETVDGHPAVRFTGVNVQVVSGSGSTQGQVNGTGNLIVGYNENQDGESRLGSHNLVAGFDNAYGSYGGLVVGNDNTISGPFSVVAGGMGNTASGSSASITGGFGNSASGSSASVSGGTFNAATGPQSSISGGLGNLAEGSESSVSGGTFNVATGEDSSISGGFRDRWDDREHLG